MTPDPNEPFKLSRREFFFKSDCPRGQGHLGAVPTGITSRPNPTSSVPRRLSAARDLYSHIVRMQGWVVPDEARNERSGTVVFNGVVRGVTRTDTETPLQPGR